MSDIITTLNKKGDRTVNVYPNILGANIPANAIDSSKLASNSVTTGKLASNSVTTGKIDNKAVTDAKLNDNAVTTDKIQDLAVTTAKINDDAITSDKINDNAVTRNKLDGNKYINQYEYDLSDADFSAYDVDGGLLNIEFNYDSTTQSTTFWDDIDEDLNIIKGGYFHRSSVYYVIVKAYKYNATSINLLGVSSTGIKLVTIPISVLVTTATNFTYINLI